ncbi:hypothetical protein [Variovorax guangxiensis]|uniref:hypothetical protein n=1 Tax=Variovorax guangxiensis TaxID=1775474 RepID=UPI00286A486E|nr:hypothetical protein [Variovorax guangxiensis]
MFGALVAFRKKGNSAYITTLQAHQQGLGPERIGRAWGVLMNRLGYGRYVVQGGDWGAPITPGPGRLARDPPESACDVDKP